jgi:hypothetical protein
MILWAAARPAWAEEAPAAPAAQPAAAAIQAPAADVPLPPPPAGTTLQPAAEPIGAKPAAPAEPEVRLDTDRRGAAALTVTQDLESDKTRQAWASAGGVLAAFDGNIGMTMIYKDLSKQVGTGAYMNGAGLNAGLHVAVLYLDAPKYETNDTSWFALKLGGGFDLSSINVTTHIPRTCVGSYCSPAQDQSATMSQQAVVGAIGLMTATGGFKSPTEWDGFAIGLEWAPSQVKTQMTDSKTKRTVTASSTNSGGFAIGLESGSLQTISQKLASKARLKMRIFMLPPAGDMPLFVSVAIGAVWY